MTSKAELQDLLRFLTQEAKLPLKDAMSRVAPLQKASLTRVDIISKASLPTLEPLLNTTPDSKTARQVLTAAKRVSKKRQLGPVSATSPAKISSDRDSVSSPSPFKKLRTESSDPTGSSLEVSLTLPVPSSPVPIETLQATIMMSNRAPVLLAFAVVLLAYTHPHQPLSSRLSLAQAVVSANSRSKAVSLGLESGKSAEEEGWGQGQPAIKIMGREIRVLRRWGYVPEHVEQAASGETEASERGNGERPDSEYATYNVDASEASFALSSSTLVGDTSEPPSSTSTVAKVDQSPQRKQIPQGELQTERTVPLWGLDTEALRDSNSRSSLVSRPGPHGNTNTNLPIYTPQSARSYLLKSFASAPSKDSDTTAGAVPSAKKKLSAKEEAQQKEHNLSLLLTALDILFSSWAKVLSREELDRRAWGWYVAVRPDVKTGVKGWGERGAVELREILRLRREE